MIVRQLLEMRPFLGVLSLALPLLGWIGSGIGFALGGPLGQWTLLAALFAAPAVGIVSAVAAFLRLEPYPAIPLLGFVANIVFAVFAVSAVVL